MWRSGLALFVAFLLEDEVAGADDARVEVDVRVAATAAAVEVLGSKTRLRVAAAKVEVEALTSMIEAFGSRYSKYRKEK